MTKFILAAAMLFAMPVHAQDYTCQDNSVVKGGSTQFTIRRSGSDFTIEKGNATKGRAVKRGDKYEVEVDGSTKATIEGGTIIRGGATWGSVSEAQQQFDCNGNVAATLWVLFKIGALP
jgi:hypothetical protein